MVVQLMAHQWVFIGRNWTQLSNAGYERVAGGLYVPGDRILVGSIREGPVAAPPLEEEQPVAWELKPHHELARQAWLCTSPKTVTSETLINRERRIGGRSQPMIRIGQIRSHALGSKYQSGVCMMRLTKG